MTRSSGSIGGASAMRRQRIVRDTAYSFYVVAKNLYGTAWAHHFFAIWVARKAVIQVVPGPVGAIPDGGIASLWQQSENGRLLHLFRR